MAAYELAFEVCPAPGQETLRVLNFFLEALTRTNELVYRRFPHAPCCPKCAGIHYHRPTPEELASPRERCYSVERLLVLGVGKCGDIAAMVAGKMRAEGRKVMAEAIPNPANPRALEENDFHAVVRLEGGGFEDPTAELVESEPGCACAA